MSGIQHYGTGRRKTSTARVFLRPGEGRATVNGRDFEEYFASDVLKMVVRQPFVVTDTVDQFDMYITVAGGGSSGQAGAIRHGLSRALLAFNPELRGRLREAGFLTRNPRMKERKKYGQKGARARYQFSKR